MTPMMDQYFEVKNQYKDYLLFYRLGDFYEMFFDDAITASRVLGLTLTGRDCGEPERAPMCGVPYHASEEYIGKLIAKGYKVAICEQMEDPALAKGLVKREVIRVVTPGTLIESNLIPERENNYMCAVCMDDFEYGVCFADVSTAQIYATSISGDGLDEKLINELGTYNPSEVISNIPVQKFPKVAEFITGRMSAMISDKQSARFDYSDAKELVSRQFCDTVGADVLDDKPLTAAVGALLGYIADMRKSDISYIKELSVYGDNQYLNMDVNSRRNLELVETMRTKEKRGSLLWVLDKTKTSPGARLLRMWLEHPLRNVAQIGRRQSAVEEFYNNYMLREQVGDLLSHVLDLERLITKIVYGTANGKDLRAVATTSAVLPELRKLLAACTSSELTRIRDNMDLLADVNERIDKAICEDPPFLIREGGIIADGYNQELDYQRSVRDNGRDWMEKIAEREREATGIKTLRIGYNNVFGYYIEVTKSLIGSVPDRYIRRQTLANCERYVTTEIKEMEQTIFGASDKIKAMEYDLFQEVRKFVSDNSERIQKTAALLSELDVYMSLAAVAAQNRYVRPTVDMSDTISIKDGRHPVVEKFVKEAYFVPNDTLLDTSNNRLMLITGPNMAGKSTYMRQTALIVIMAQMGSFVPAAEATIGVVDKVFTRVGASDDLASGQSTFMLEMNEVAYILANATRKSLIIYDEVGRGTSTFDGMSIARAIVEYTYSRKIGAKTLFATHYHELTNMENEFPGIVNYNIAAKKRGDNIIFLRKIVRGATDDSYGIEVAKLAGIPNEVIKRAKEVLETTVETAKALKGSKPEAEETDGMAMNLEDCLNQQIIDELKVTDINTLSPFECMQLLYGWKKRLP